MIGRDQIVDKRRSDADSLVSKSTATSSSRRHGMVKEFLPKGEVSCSVDVTILALPNRRMKTSLFGDTWQNPVALAAFWAPKPLDVADC